jgi:hypothetical protein
MTRTLSPAMDAWLAKRETAERALAIAVEPFRDEHGKLEPRRTSPDWTRTVEFTEAEWRFLWARFQPVGTPMIGFARRLQVSTGDVMSLSAEQRCWALALAFKYRRKVFFNPRAALLNETQFVAGVRKLAAKETMRA